MGVLQDVETSVLRFEVFSVFLGSFCVERYPFQDGREIIDLLKSPESVKKTLTLMAE